MQQIATVGGPCGCGQQDGQQHSSPPTPTPHDPGGRQGRCLSHLVGGAEGGLAELADLPDVLPGHDPSPPETPTYHALDVGVQAQRRRALRFAAGRGDGEECERTHPTTTTTTTTVMSQQEEME